MLREVGTWAVVLGPGAKVHTHSPWGDGSHSDADEALLPV